MTFQIGMLDGRPGQALGALDHLSLAALGIGSGWPSFEAQLQASLIPSRAVGGGTPTFTRATTATVLGYAAAAVIADGPTLLSCASGEARFMGARRVSEGVWATTDANGVALTTGNGASAACTDASGPFGYLSEGARTNLVLQSSDFTATWTAIGTPTNAAGDAVGGVTTQVIGDDSAVALEGYGQNVTFTGNAVKTVSLFVKQGTSTSSVIQLRDNTAGTNRLLAAVTWSGTVPVVTMTTGTDLTGTPVQLGTSGKYRLMFATTSVTAANTNALRILPATDAALSVLSTGTLECGGVQAENGTFTSTYIPTTTGTVARNADVLTYAAAGNVSNAQGSAYSEATATSVANITGGNTRTLADGGSDAAWQFVGGVTQPCSLFDGTTQVDCGAVAAITNNAVWKSASSWVGAVMSAVANGGAVGTGVYDGSFGTPTSIGIGQFSGGSQLFGTIRNVRIYPTALSDARLQAMTA